MMPLLTLIPELPGVPAETVQALQAERLRVERGCDAQAYALLAEQFARAGLISAANRLLERANYYLQALQHHRSATITMQHIPAGGGNHATSEA